MSVNKKKDNKKIEGHFIKNLAYWYSKTYSIEEAANKVDLDQSTAVELAGHPDFKKALGDISPDLLESWNESKEDDSVGIKVRSEAKRDGSFFYKMMKEDLQEMAPKDRIPLLEKLLRLGGYFDKEEHRETITLSPSVVASIRETAKEMDTAPEDIKSPYDA